IKLLFKGLGLVNGKVLLFRSIQLANAAHNALTFVFPFFHGLFIGKFDRNLNAPSQTKALTIRRNGRDSPPVHIRQAQKFSLFLQNANYPESLPSNAYLLAQRTLPIKKLISQRGPEHGYINAAAYLFG